MLSALISIPLLCPIKHFHMNSVILQLLDEHGNIPSTSSVLTPTKTATPLKQATPSTGASNTSGSRFICIDILNNSEQDMYLAAKSSANSTPSKQVPNVAALAALQLAMSSTKSNNPIALQQTLQAMGNADPQLMQVFSQNPQMFQQVVQVCERSPKWTDLYSPCKHK